MLFRKLVLLGGACTLLLAYHGGYWALLNKSNFC